MRAVKPRVVYLGGWAATEINVRPLRRKRVAQSFAAHANEFCSVVCVASERDAQSFAAHAKEVAQSFASHGRTSHANEYCPVVCVARKRSCPVVCVARRTSHANEYCSVVCVASERDAQSFASHAKGVAQSFASRVARRTQTSTVFVMQTRIGY